MFNCMYLAVLSYGSLVISEMQEERSSQPNTCGRNHSNFCWEARFCHDTIQQTARFGFAVCAKR